METKSPDRFMSSSEATTPVKDSRMFNAKAIMLQRRKVATTMTSIFAIEISFVWD
jgi:hypothetical protein